MKKLIGTLLCIISIILILSFPKTVTEGVQCGITLCLYTVIPALFPFLLVVNLMQKYDSAKYLSYLTSPILNRIFRVSANGCFAIITGFSCGYPMGAKVISDLHTSGKITLSESKYLITFCNNCSISFLINYIFLNILEKRMITAFQAKYYVWIIVFLIYTPAIITGILNKFLIRPVIKNETMNPTSCCQNPILSSIKSISNLSVYVICFTIFSRLIFHIDMNEKFKSIICAICEITSGAPILSSSIGDNTLCTYLILLFSVFGGFSITMQSLSQLKEPVLKKYYIIGKIENMIIFSILFALLLFYYK